MNIFERIDDNDEDEYFRPKILLFLVLGTILILVFKCESSEDYYKRKLGNEQYSGIITKRFIDAENHHNKTVIFQNGNVSTPLNFRWIQLYDSCKINDKIIKEKGKRVLYLIRTAKNDTLTLDFDRNSIDTGDIILRYSK